MSSLGAFDHIFDSVLVVNDSAELNYFNHHASIFFKMSPRLFRTKEFPWDIFESKDLDLKSWIQEHLNITDISVSPEIKINLIHDIDTEYFVIMKLVPIELESNQNFALILHDVTVEKNLHTKYKNQLEELKKTHSQILQADKLSTLGELTASISHEINNPLTIAAGNSEIIKDVLDNPQFASKLPLLKNANSSIIESLERVNQIIKNMKDFLRQNEDQKEYCDLETLLETSMEWIAPVAKKAGIKISRDIRGPRTVALANRIKLEQVIINLIKNSVDALKDSQTKNGTIKLTLSKSTKDHQTFIDVIDNGPGISESIKKDLFKPFMTTKDAGVGTGLGLSICAKIMETHQGKLEHLETSSGCHFRARLPLIESYSYTRNDRSLQGSIKQKRILVLDNEVQILNVLNTFIKDEGLVFIGSSEPLDALSFLPKANVDLIVTDYSMPGMNGDEFVKKARENGYQGPILYMTSSKHISDFNRDKEDLALNGLIIKPFNKEDVMKSIQSALLSGEEK